MIKVTPEVFHGEEERKIKLWLNAEGKTLATKVVRSHIAQLEAKAANLVMKNAAAHLSQQTFAPGTEIDFKEAAQWQLFLDKLRELHTFDLKLWRVEVDHIPEPVIAPTE